MENGVGGNLARQLSTLTIGATVNGYSNSNNDINGVNKSDGLFQVMKAVEAAEATIKQQKSINPKAENSQPTGQWSDDGYQPRSKSQTEGNKMQNEPAFYDPSETQKINEAVKMLPANQTLFSPSRYQLEQEYDPQFNISPYEHGLVPISDVKNTAIPLNQVVVDTRDQEQEILLLRKHLADYSIKEAQILNEKFALENRIAYMRLAFDQQQQDLVDAASKAISYRQEIIEENIRLIYALQDAEEERSTFISSLMPHLTEYSLQPPAVDAQSIVNNVKVLFKHLQERLNSIETKLKESQYQIAAWRSDVDPSSYAQSPLYTFGNKNRLELVPQIAYNDGQIPISSDNLESVSGMYSPLVNRNDHSLGTNGGDSSYPISKKEESSNKQVTFSDPVSHNNDDDGEAFGNWNNKNPNPNTPEDDPNSYSPYLTPVLEEPGSSFSEAADDDPLPAVESLQISGEAFPGRELVASGYSLNGTTSCNFEWVRHMEDGSVSYIEGAKQPNYIVTADDVDTYLAIEVQPMDNRKRKGELVKVFANEHRKIVCDPEMHEHIRKALHAGYAEHKMSLWSGYLDI